LLEIAAGGEATPLSGRSFSPLLRYVSASDRTDQHLVEVM
jgi:hypothetical protein